MQRVAWVPPLSMLLPCYNRHNPPSLHGIATADWPDMADMMIELKQRVEERKAMRRSGGGASSASQGSGGRSGATSSRRA